VQRQSDVLRPVMVLITALLISLPFWAVRNGIGRQQPVIRVSSNLVMVPVSVTDSSGKAINNLQSSDFHIEENGRTEEIAKMFEPGQTPLELALMFDVSGSVNPRFEFEQQAATRFLKQIMRPGDTIVILSLAAEPHVLQPQTYSLYDALSSLEKLEPTRGMTAFFDALVLGAHLLRKSASPQSRRVEVVLSDGEDNNSTNQLPDTLQELQRADCILYSINPTGPSVRLNQLSLKGQEIMQTLASQTGGVAFLPSSEQEFNSIFSQIAAELQAQYMLGYYSSNTATDGSFRRIIVTVPERPDLRIRARQGYYAPKG